MDGGALAMEFLKPNEDRLAYGEGLLFKIFRELTLRIAERLLKQRESVVARLKRLGAQIVDAPAEGAKFLRGGDHADGFAFVQELVRNESAIVLGEGKEYLVEARPEAMGHYFAFLKDPRATPETSDAVGTPAPPPSAAP